MSLQDVTILVTTFLRPGYLRKTLEGIRANLPECPVLVVDDSDNPSAESIHLPFDSGLPAKRNAGVKACTTKYLLMGCDDFDFSTAEARAGVEKLVRVMDEFPEIDVAGGRVDHRPYEGFLEYNPGEYIKETPLTGEGPAGTVYLTVDLTVNYFMARTESIRPFPWPEEMRIGGEHVCFFLDLKLANKYVVWVPGVNVNTLKLGQGSNVQDPRYRGFRMRAINLGHPLMKKRYDIKDYIGFDGGKS
jgi:glycosyltransferase involved in cell wall biosynthesis